MPGCFFLLIGDQGPGPIFLLFLPLVAFLVTWLSLTYECFPSSERICYTEVLEKRGPWKQSMYSSQQCEV